MEPAGAVTGCASPATACSYPHEHCANPSRQRIRLAWVMLPILVQHLPRDRKRMGLREVEMAGRLHLTLRQYRAHEAGELHITNDLYERIVDLCGWPR